MIHVVPGAPYDIKIKEGDEEVPTALVTWKRPNIKEKIKGKVRVMVFNATLTNISVISWWSVLLVEKTQKSLTNFIA